MTDKELKVLTVNSMVGNWIGADDNYEIKISISSEAAKVDITSKEGGETETNVLATSNSWWVEQFFNFIDCNQRFYILYANETEMLFGECKTPTCFDGQNIWQIKFGRV